MFYRRKLSFKARTFNKIFPLHDYFGEMIGDKKEVDILDIGAGMFSTTGSTWPDVKVHLYACDVLADEFNAMLKAHNVVPVIPVTKEDMTQLSYPDNFFDIVHCENALDHCADPMRALQEMYRVCKKGGFIYLSHFENVGEMMHYCGFHLWNIKGENGDCIIWNQDGTYKLSDFYKILSVEEKHDPTKKPNTVTAVKIVKTT